MSVESEKKWWSHGTRLELEDKIALFTCSPSLSLLCMWVARRRWWAYRLPVVLRKIPQKSLQDTFRRRDWGWPGPFDPFPTTTDSFSIVMVFIWPPPLQVRPLDPSWNRSILQIPSTRVALTRFETQIKRAIKIERLEFWRSKAVTLTFMNETRRINQSWLKGEKRRHV